MKRIEAIIASEKLLPVNEALKNAGVGGCTVLMLRVEEKEKTYG